jgi:uncharacterized protein
VPHKYFPPRLSVEKGLQSIRQMRITLVFLVLAISLHADFAAGMRAYQAQDYTTALNQWLPLAEQGVPQAQYDIGLIYAMGHGVQKDAAQAASWYQKAAEQGIVEAQFNLGLLYFEGDGLQKDFEHAEKWLKQAAENGDLKAADTLADLYAHEVHNDAEAKNWYEKAAERGSAKAEFGLGVIFDLGKGVPADPAEAGKWYRKAAEQGYAPALTNIGILYYDGQGVKRDMVLAREYFLLGENRGDPRASGLVEWTTNKLTKKELKRATDLAHNWESAHSMQAISSNRSAGPVSAIQ